MLSDNTDKLAMRYASAMAHSRLVRFLKLALPSAAVILIGVFVALSYVRTLLPQNVSVLSAAIEDGSIIMSEPIISGQGADNTTYRFKAERAIQEIGDTSRILFEMMEGELPLNAGALAYISAEEGLFDQSQNIVTFTKPFDVELETGIKARFADGIFNMDMSQFETTNGVNVEFGSGTLSAQIIRLRNSGETILFEGDVRMRVSADLANRTYR